MTTHAPWVLERLISLHTIAAGENGGKSRQYHELKIAQFQTDLGDKDALAKHDARWNAKYTLVSNRKGKTIKFKKNASLHACNASCKHATGDVCECSCHGENHGSHQ